MTGKTSFEPVSYKSLSAYGRRKIRQMYVEAQKGRCWFCNEFLTGQPTKRVLTAEIDWRLFPEGFTRYPVHLHHDHKTGMTVGAVHARCNAYLWQYLGK